MTQVASRTFIGVDMATHGPPVIVVGEYADGRLGRLSVLDTAVASTWPYGDTPGWAVPSQEPGETTSGGAL